MSTENTTSFSSHTTAHATTHTGIHPSANTTANTTANTGASSSPRPAASGKVKIIHPSGGYRKLIVYDKSDTICQGTVLFCKRFMPPYGDRTVDQMMQAARSCKQNIVEGSEAAATSLETQIKLTNVARASLAELLQDYSDYLKFHNLPQWSVDHPRTSKLRIFARENPGWESWQGILEKCDDEVFCNTLVTIIKQTMHMLDKLIKAQEKDFRENGGIRERMTAVRLGVRNMQQEQIDALRVKLDDMQKENAALKAENAALKVENAALKVENAALRNGQAT